MTNSSFPWIGGKCRLRKEILKYFPEGKPKRYIEGFGGAGWVLLAADKHAELEIFNDIDGHLINLYRCIKYHCEELRVLKTNGVLIFKWNEEQIKTQDIIKLAPAPPLFGDRRSKTHWLVFIKKSAEQIPEVLTKRQPAMCVTRKEFNMNTLKSNSRSFRYSDRVAEILDGFKGNSLNDKFNNLVLFCFEELPKKQKALKDIDKIM